MRDCRFWQIFLTRVRQAFPDLTPFSLLVFATPPASLDLDEFHEFKITKTNLVDETYNCTISIFCRFVPCRTKCALKFSRFIMLVSVQYTAYQAMYPSRNCLQIYGFLIYCHFSCQAVSILPSLIRVNSEHSKNTFSGNFLVALSVHCYLLLVHGGLRDARK